MDNAWPEYALATVHNAQYLGSALHLRGFNVAARDFGFTKSHQLWIDTSDHMDAFEAVKALARCGIIVNTINAPAFPGKLSLRIGVQEITYLKANDDDMECIADIFEQILIKQHYSEEKIQHRINVMKQKLLFQSNGQQTSDMLAVFRQNQNIR